MSRSTVRRTEESTSALSPRLAQVPRAYVRVVRVRSAGDRVRQPQDRRHGAVARWRGRAQRGVPRAGRALLERRHPGPGRASQGQAVRRERGVAGDQGHRRRFARRGVRVPGRAQRAYRDVAERIHRRAVPEARRITPERVRERGEAFDDPAARDPLRGMRVGTRQEGAAQPPRAVQGRLVFRARRRHRRHGRFEGVRPRPRDLDGRAAREQPPAVRREREGQMVHEPRRCASRPRMAAAGPGAGEGPGGQGRHEHADRRRRHPRLAPHPGPRSRTRIGGAAPVKALRRRQAGNACDVARRRITNPRCKQIRTILETGQDRIVEEGGELRVGLPGEDDADERGYIRAADYWQRGQTAR